MGQARRRRSARGRRLLHTGLVRAQRRPVSAARWGGTPRAAVAAYSSFIRQRVASFGAWLRYGHDYDGLVLPRWINAGAAVIVTLVAAASLAQDASKGRPIAAAVAVIPEIVIVIRPGVRIWIALSITTIGALGLIGGNSAAIGILALLCPAGQAGLFTPLRRGLVVVGILSAFLFGHQIADLSITTRRGGTCPASGAS